MSDVLSEGAYLDGHVVADRGAFTLDAEVCARAGQVVALSLIHISEPTRPY